MSGEWVCVGVGLGVPVSLGKHDVCRLGRERGLGKETSSGGAEACGGEIGMGAGEDDLPPSDRSSSCRVGGLAPGTRGPLVPGGERGKPDGEHLGLCWHLQVGVVPSPGWEGRTEP